MPDSITPSPLIPAATVVLLRDTEGRLETLMLRRNQRLKSFGGAWVFPGGRVDDADLPGGEDLIRARHAAVREAHEETGLIINPDDLVELSRWIPPPQEKRRFSTWFFVGQAPDAPVKIDEGEIHDYRWMCPKDLIANVPNPDMLLMPPTYVTLTEIAKFETVAAALAGIASRGNELFETRFTRTKNGFATIWEPDAAYETMDLEAEGPRRRLVTGPLKWEYLKSD